MKEEIKSIAKKLFEKYPEIVDPTILKDHEMLEFLKKAGLNSDFSDYELIMIRIYWANLIFWEK
ncbi:MAG TPA: hypothetical protein VKU94_04375 [Geobacterales bacterium]|nr:hypothetical protein [Geobacterales bacterium]